MGPWATAFTIFKGFVATGILYMPVDFINGGYIFSLITILLSLVLTLYCAKLLIEVHDKLGGSFSDMGKVCYGIWGKTAVDISLAGSQIGFTCAYVYFIATNGQSVVAYASGNVDANNNPTDLIDKWWFGLLCFCIYVPLVFVRKIEKFAITHLFGDIMIIIAVIAICSYAGVKVNKDGFNGGELKPINYALFPDAIGFAVYTFEGIGVIIPIKEITACKDYYKILCKVCFFITFIYVVFSEFLVFTYGTDLTTPLITDQLPPESPVVWTIKLLFSFNLIFSYPLVIFPANMVIESYLFAGWPKSKRRQWMKNLSRTLIVTLTVVIAMLVWDKLDKFLSITGSLFCTPIAFILPALFHFKACADTPRQRAIDMSIVVLGCTIMFFCTIWGVVQWNA